MRITKNAPYLFDEPHWQIDSVRDLKGFFSNLNALVPSGSIIYLASGSWSEEIFAFINTHAQNYPGRERLPDEFNDARRVPINRETMLALADIATRHAEPEIAIHLCVYAENQSVLEWYDLTDDPITVSISISEEKIGDFAASCGVGFRKAQTN